LRIRGLRIDREKAMRYIHQEKTQSNSEEGVMNDTIYQKLAKTLDTLPNGFPSTESGVEIRI